MQLPLTSIIPSTVELISFWEKNWSHIWWFPNWYLGVPYRFLTGPIVPVLVILVRKIVPVSIETIYIGLIGVMGVIGGIGVNFFCKEMGAGKRTAGFISLLYIILPFSVWFLTISSGLGNIAISVVPWIWVAFLRSLKSLKEFKLIRGKIYLLTTALLTALVLLINPATILATTIGMGILVFLGERKLWIDKSLKLLIVLLSGSSIATIWYSPRFWWILLGNPSFAGKPLVNVIHFVLQLTEAVVPLILGIWIVQKKHILYSKNVQFAVLFGASFLFLSVIRLLSDADFWMDWIGYISDSRRISGKPVFKKADNGVVCSCGDSCSRNLYITYIV